MQQSCSIDANGAMGSGSGAANRRTASFASLSPPQAFSAYFFVMNFLNLTDTSMSLDAVKLELARYCSTPWNQVGHI